MNLVHTPNANRLHIALFGKRNSGKSSLINALTGQDTALVSDTPGTTTDPVQKAMEIHGIGPCLFIDTPGFDDEGELGNRRIERTWKAISETVALYGWEQTSQLLNNFITVGASGAAFGILLAFGMLFPNAPLFIIFIPIPIKAKYFVIFYGLLELFFGVSGSMSSVAHFAHLGGMLFGFFLIRYWKKKGIGGGGFYY